MNRGSKLTLPTLNPFTDRQNSKSRRKFIKGWPHNDTFSNWKRNNKRSERPNLSDLSSVQGCPAEIPPVKGGSTRKIVTGMTLGDYFRTRSSTQINETSAQYQVSEEDILPYLKENFDIHETDEDNYNESETSIKVGRDGSKQTVKQQLHFDKGYPIKMKTECDQLTSRQNYPYPSTLKKKLSALNKSRDKMQYMQQSFDLKSSSRSRNLPQEVRQRNKHDTIKKSDILSRVQIDKPKVAQLKNFNVDLVVKYANKFKLAQMYIDSARHVQ